ncbi:DUF4194 domain-containing protein [Tsukamurella sp. 1534]|uniref:DUF4194 domain-containing protein n=1 Tax=Tsukamurella sp. 1534 TaxID=1151061 RepID=UPI00031B7E4F|nr:DUF4194 domain-containing protein [Tsukamurella sp. 1534]
MTDESFEIETAGLPEIDLADFSIGDEEAVRSLRGADTAPRFDGDSSQLPNSVCYALQELIAAPHVSSRSKNWAVIEAEETLLRSRLSELNLLLEINRETKHAFTRQVGENDPRQRNLLRAQSLSLAASVLALFLRLKYLSSPDETAVVERQEMIDHLLSFRPARDTDEAGFVKKADAAINQLETRRLIRRVGTGERYAVHSVIASLLTPEQVDLYTAAYRDLANADHDLGEAAATVETDAADDEPVDTEEGDA